MIALPLVGVGNAIRRPLSDRDVWGGSFATDPARAHPMLFAVLRHTHTILAYLLFAHDSRAPRRGALPHARRARSDPRPNEDLARTQGQGRNRSDTEEL